MTTTTTTTTTTTAAAAAATEAPRSLSQLSFESIDDDEPITPTNREEKLRKALGHILIDQRRDILAALASGFALNGEMATLRESFKCFSVRERKRVVSGAEHVNAASLVSIVQPIWPEEDVDMDAEDEDYESANVDLNYDLFTRVLKSEAFEPHLTGLLRFITGCPSIIDPNMTIEVNFVRTQPSTAVPTAHTCFQSLDLSTSPYESEDYLCSLLRICARNSTAFGRQ